ncbi:hypothetical protein DNFV4_00328 [Nitrospira tepida]|uniref:Uncharacterized protein n=1 Tax=Nitrospira tepida TaxID=2973512 RepID=A0AA86MVS9_9BACT|nr:hypothetical protein [Nitrospira tepida]CAI4029908.1 hypothetical protein DNFV4_00328 [Nitrospira tepida]
MPFDEETEIQRKILRLLRAKGGLWSEEEFTHIEAGPLDLARHMAILVERGHVEHDPVRHCYLLTARGVDRLNELEASE